MEKQIRSIISFLPKCLSSPSSSIPCHPHSPGSGNPTKLRAFQTKGFSGPMVSIIPMEARRKQKSGDSETPREPTSPKVTCMGQIKLKRCKKSSSTPPTSSDQRERKPPPAALLIHRLFRRKARPPPAVPQAAAESRSAERPAAGPAPLLGQTRRLSSSRESLRDFDWRKVVDAGGGRAYPGEEGSDEEDEAFIAHSAPIIMGGRVVAGEPRKKINLWKRKAMDAPVPLQLNR